MNPFEETLVTEYILSKERIEALEDTLKQLRSQLRDTHSEDSVLITTINNALEYGR